jgi:DNA-binding phage protein
MLSSSEQVSILHQIVSGSDRPGHADEMSGILRSAYDALQGCPLEERKFCLSEVLSPLANGQDLYHAILDVDAATSGNYSTYADLALDLPPIEWFWPGWIPNGLLSCLAAPPGAGKSMVALDLACRVASHLPCPDGQPLVPRSDVIVYVDAESVPQINIARAKHWNMPLDRIYPLLPPPYGMIDLNGTADRDRMIEMANAVQPGLIVIDSLSMITTLGDSSVEDVRPILTFLSHLAHDIDCALLLIHHTRKRMANTLPGMDLTADDLRGSGHIIAACRSILGLAIVQTGPDLDLNGPRRLQILKTNLGGYPRALGVHFRACDGGVDVHYGDAPTPYRAPTEADQCAEWLLATLQEAGELSPAELVELAEAAGFSRSTVYRAREALGSQVANSDGRRSHNNEWSLNAGAQPANPTPEAWDRRTPVRPTRADQCAEWLLTTLQRAGKPMAPADLVALAEAAGYSRRTLYRAREALGSQIVDTVGRLSPCNCWALSGDDSQA